MKTRLSGKCPPVKGRQGTEIWVLKLYVAGATPKSLEAFSNLRRICREHLPGQHRIQVIDLLKNPALARDDQILAVPTLVRKLPTPLRKIIGDLSDTGHVLIGLDVRPPHPEKGGPHA